MKRMCAWLALLMCLLIGVTLLCACNKSLVECAELDNGQMKIMSLNLRYITPNDTNERAWDCRKELVVQNLQQVKPSIIGMQEVTPQQYKYLKKYLKNYQSEITYRDNAKQSEGCPIFYYKGLYTLIDKGTFWLSETPDVMSKDWEARHYRICTYVVLCDKGTNKKFAVFNTHLDNVSEIARINSINLIINKIHSIGDYPSIIMGDFNSTENSQTYLKATDALLDVRYQVENSFVNHSTYHNWGHKLNGGPIDYFLISKTGFSVDNYEVVTTTYNGCYISDHFPIVTLLTLND